MSGHRPFSDLAKTCESCSTIMPIRSVRSFVDDGIVKYVCRDTEACEARRADRVRRALKTSDSIVDALNRLTERVEALEAARRYTVQPPPPPY